jgi:hypothetical protein
MTATQDHKREYFEKCTRDYRLSDGTPEYGDKPDVLFKGAQTIGIEITKFYRDSGHVPSSEQKQKPLRKAVLRGAQKLYRAAGGKQIELQVGFNAKHPVTPSRMKKLPQELAEVAKNIDRDQSGQVNSIHFDHIAEINWVWLTAEDSRNEQWKLVQVHDVKLTSEENLIEIISGKEAKSVEYKPCDAYWLLVVVDWRDAAQEEEIIVPGGLKVASRVFQRVLLYKPDFQDIVEVWP